MSKFAQTTTMISVHSPGDNPVFGDSVVTVSLDDDGGGLFINLRQPSGAGEVTMDYEQLLLVVDAARMLMEGVGPEDGAV